MDACCVLCKKARKIEYPDNRGKGFAVKQGVLDARYDWICYYDADGATPIEMIERIISELDNYDLFISSRNMKESKIFISQSIYRRVLGKIFAWLTKLFIGTKLTDLQNGFKVFNKETREIFRYQVEERFSFDIEFIMNAERLKLRIKEFPINWSNDKRSKVKLIDIIEMGISLWKIRKRL